MKILNDNGEHIIPPEQVQQFLQGQLVACLIGTTAQFCANANIELPDFRLHYLKQHLFEVVQDMFNVETFNLQ